MRDDPMRQVDIARRLANMAAAPRCGARTRDGHPCQQAAVRGRARCRMHGGAKGSGGPRGDRNGNFKHGLWTRDSVAARRAIRAEMAEIRALLRAGQGRVIGLGGAKPPVKGTKGGARNPKGGFRDMGRGV
jgi:hypothetical protein